VAVFTSSQTPFCPVCSTKEREKEVGLATDVGGRAKELFGADEVTRSQNRRRSCPSRKADRIYYHLGRDRAFNETLLKHWQRLMATYPKRGTGPLQLKMLGHSS